MFESTETKVKNLAKNKLITADIKKKHKDKKDKEKKQKQQKEKEDEQKKSDTLVYKANKKAINPNFYNLYADLLTKCSNDIDADVAKINELQCQNRQEMIDSVKKQHEEEREENITKLFHAYDTVIQDIIEYELKYIDKQSDFGTKFSEFVKTARTKAEAIFAKNQTKALKAYRAKCKAKNAQIDKDTKTADVNSSLSEVPKKIQDTIADTRKKLDAILGKLDLDLDDIDTEPSDFAKPILALLNPFLGAMTSLNAVVPPVPVLGDLAPIITSAANSKPTTITKPEIKKKCPKTPEIPPKIQNDANDIKDDVFLVCSTIPMLLINVILQMIDVIYSKLQTITSVIPLGNLFPLSLLPAAKTVVVKGTSLMTSMPGMLYNMIKAQIRQKLAEACALSMPSPALSVDASPDPKNANPGSPEKKYSYDDVNLSMLVKPLSSLGFGNDPSLSAKYFQKLYTMYDLNKILDNYLKIFNGQHLDEGRDISYYKLASDLSSLEIDSMDRTKATPECYKDYLDKRIEKSQSKLSTELDYKKYISTEDLIGSLDYKKYKDDIEEKHKHVVVQASVNSNSAGLKAQI